MRSYESVTIFPGWCEGQGLGPESIETIRGLIAKNCVVFLFVNGDQVMEAADFLHTLTAVDGGAYVFKSWHKVTVKKVPRTHREGPRGCVVADNVQIWALRLNRPEVHNNKTTQTVVSQKPTEIMDHIADHVNTDQRVAVVFGDHYKPATQIGSTEFDVFSMTEDKIVKSKTFSPQNCRKSRMLKAYVESQDVKQLTTDRKMLSEGCSTTEATNENPFVLSDLIQNSGMEIAQVEKLLTRVISKKRKSAKSKDAKATRPVNRASGIAAKCQITDKLRDFLVEHCELTVPEDGIARTEVVRAIPAYIKKHGLNNGRIVSLDDNLKTLVRDEDVADQEVTFFTIYKFINHNFIKAQKTEAETQDEVPEEEVPEPNVPEVKVPEPNVSKKRKAAATQKGQPKKAKSK